MKWILLLFGLITISGAQLWASEIQAWVYPGNPNCNAKNEMSDGRKIHVIKAEYFTFDTSGGLTSILEDSSNMATTCNGWSTSNEQTIKTNSIDQYATVSGGGTNFLNMLASASLRSSTVATLTNWVVQHGFTGIELNFASFGDWSAADYQNYQTFLTSMGNSLHASSKKLMIIGPPIADSSNQAWFTTGFHYEHMNALPVDFIVVAAYNYMYDYSCLYPTAPTSWLNKVIDWTKSKVTDINKIVIALPANGFFGVMTSYNPNVRTTNDIRARTGANGAFVNQDSYEKTWNNTNTINYFCDSACLNSKRTFIESKGISRISVNHLGGNDWFTGRSEVYPWSGNPTSASSQTTQQSTTSAPSSAPTSEPTSAPTSAPSSEPTSEQSSAQSSAQTSEQTSAQSSQTPVPTSVPSSQIVPGTSETFPEDSASDPIDIISDGGRSSDDKPFYIQIWFFVTVGAFALIVVISLVFLALFMRRRGRKFNNEKLDVSSLDLPFSVPPPLPPPFDQDSEVDPDSLSAAMPSTPERIRHSLAHAGLMPIPPSISNTYHVEV